MVAFTARSTSLTWVRKADVRSGHSVAGEFSDVGTLRQLRRRQRDERVLDER